MASNPTASKPKGRHMKRTLTKPVEKPHIMTPERIHALNGIMRYMFPDYMADILPILEKFIHYEELNIMIARGNCSNVGRCTPEQIDNIEFRHIYGMRLPTPIEYVNIAGSKRLIHKTSDYWIFLGTNATIDKITSKDLQIAHNMKQIELVSMVSTHANPDSHPGLILRNTVLKCSYCVITKAYVPYDLNIFMKNATISRYELDAELVDSGPVARMKTDILAAAEEKAKAIIEKIGRAHV